MTNKNCPVCGNPVKGRTDKVFCTNKCKSIDQYERRQRDEGLFFSIDRQLKKNRKLLKRYNRSGYTTLRRKDLEDEGFNFKYFTHYWKNKNADVYLFCYDYGYLSLKKNGLEKMVIVKWQDYMS